MAIFFHIISQKTHFVTKAHTIDSIDSDVNIYGSNSRRLTRLLHANERAITCVQIELYLCTIRSTHKNFIVSNLHTSKSNDHTLREMYIERSLVISQKSTRFIKDP